MIVRSRLLVVLLVLSFANGFIPSKRLRKLDSRLFENKNDDTTKKIDDTGKKTEALKEDSPNTKNTKSGYKFGDFTKGLLKKAGSAVTGEDDYQFGQITKGVMQNATSAIAGKEVDYEFGALSKALMDKTGMAITNYTGKSNYQVGDISKEIIRRVSSGEYKIEDIFLLCKILLSFGVGLTPIAGALPAKVLLEMMNVGLAQEVGGRLMETLAETLDKRMKKSITGDANYALGDKTKNAILNFIGKDNYSIGDISKKISELSKEAQKAGGSKSSGKGFALDPNMVAELADWDKKEKIGKSSS
mmetsp:Transcript_28900/g.42841  ORF Transcript_28900/g.42841 Transcript_28900/m.42841 type:complete len:302 (-) Transcript_28900:64-969(-)|eukprot:CAMPEP_0195525250 /NCGR_PEP_ID=MMETSP0794_2-20130614/25589_1 /TAXON_ID=515487 /ORGANISM="Stephanopyxis turris, Strain CCMP 815" /LENGTH=301 /DNA_ID=CAMNT_0040655665 /DNA_START=70 /DNA_END=975 /DNA_ORIENTATION=-